MDEKIATQVEVIRKAFSEKKINVNVLPGSKGISYMYAEHQILVREAYLERVQLFLGEQPGPDHVRPVIPGIVVLSLQQKKNRLGPEGFDTLIGRIDGTFGDGVATPDHVLTVAGEIGPCPATEPEPAYYETEPFPSARADCAGRGIRIYIADTGVLPEVSDSAWLDEHPWMDGVTGGLDQRAPGGWPATGNPIPAYAGHGTFVAGVARCLAPGAEVDVDDVFDIAGSALESHYIRKLRAALHRGYDIFHISASAPTRLNRPMQAFAAWLRETRDYKGVICVSPAGNSGSPQPSWPAAFAEVVSVGALAGDWRSRASFSNYGPWVDVYAPGRDLVNAFASGIYTCQWWPYAPQRRQFYGMATWSGTSFSSPIVTGLLAARMERTGENGQEAAAALLAEAREDAIPGVGPVLLPYRCRHERHGHEGHGRERDRGRT